MEPDELELLLTKTSVRPWEADWNRHGDGYVRNRGSFQYILERGHLHDGASVNDARLIAALVNLAPAIIALWRAADRVAFETSENEPGSHDWRLINDLRLKVVILADADTHLKAG